MRFKRLGVMFVAAVFSYYFIPPKFVALLVAGGILFAWTLIEDLKRESKKPD